MTLLELVLVVLILGLVMGMGTGVFASLDPAERAAVGLVKNVLRSAQNTATVRRAPASVEIDLAAGTMRASSQRVVGTWHFETDDLVGAFDIGGMHRDTELVDDGYIGRALGFPAGARGAHARFDVDDLPTFDLREGFVVSLALRRGADGGDLLRFGEVAGVQLTKDGRARAWFAPEVESKGGIPTAGQAVIAETAPGFVPPDRWVRLKVAYDRHALRLWLDGRLRAEVEEGAPVWTLQDPMVLGDDRRVFVGALDNLVVSVFDTGDEAALPEGLRFVETTPARVFFDEGGRLDRAAHPGPAVIELEFDDGERRAIRVGVYGTVEG